MGENFFPFCKAEWYICTYHILFIHSYLDSYLGCFPLLIIEKDAATDFDIQVPAQVPAFNSFVSMPQSGVTEPSGCIYTSLYSDTCIYNLGLKKKKKGY